MGSTLLGSVVASSGGHDMRRCNGLTQARARVGRSNLTLVVHAFFPCSGLLVVEGDDQDSCLGDFDTA